MIAIGGPNYSSPEFQRLLLKEAQSRPYAAIKNVGGAQAQWSEADAARRIAFARLGLASQIAKQNEAFNSAQLRMSEKALKERKKTFPWVIGLGGLTTLYGAYSGAKNAAAANETTQMQLQQAAATNALLQRIALAKGV